MSIARKGHRRTQSDTYNFAFPTKKIMHLPLSSKQNNQISAILQKSNRVSRPKTVYFQSLDIPVSRSLYDLMFFFGRKSVDSQTGLTTHYNEDVLCPITEKRKSNKYYQSKNRISRQKVEQNPTKNTNKQKQKNGNIDLNWKIKTPNRVNTLKCHGITTRKTEGERKEKEQRQRKDRKQKLIKSRVRQQLNVNVNINII